MEQVKARSFAALRLTERKTLNVYAMLRLLKQELKTAYPDVDVEFTYQEEKEELIILQLDKHKTTGEKRNV
jgi:hypothetical protein